MEAAMKFRVFIIFVFFVCCLLPGLSLAQNKVVIIPMIETVQVPFKPYAPLTVVSPPNTDYTIETYTVTDKISGLMWQKSDDNTTRTWNDAWDYCQNLELPTGGWTDWRLPLISELMSIVYYGTYDPAINSVAFPGSNSDAYWSANILAANLEKAWAVDYSGGYVGNDDISEALYVRCVRGKSVGYGNFENNNNGTVTDLATGLMWQREDDATPRNLADATSYCQDLDLGGERDWRLPTVKELFSIVDEKMASPVINLSFFPITWQVGYLSDIERPAKGFGLLLSILGLSAAPIFL